MNATLVVLQAEFERRVRSRSFVFGTIVGALAIMLISLLPTFLNGSVNQGKRIVLVGDPALTAAARVLLQRDFTITTTLPRMTAAPTVAFLDTHGKAGAVASLRRTGTKLHVIVYTREPGEMRHAFATDLGVLQIALLTGFPASRIASHVKVDVDERDIAGRFSDVSQAMAAKGIGYLFVMILYVTILLNAQSIVAAVTEEKTSRIAELLVAAIDPAQLLLAKVLATSATGFLQLGVWIGVALLGGRAIAGFFSTPGISDATDAATVGITAPDVLWFLLFFTLGFVQCAVLFAAAGSLVSRSEDVGNVSGPLYIPVVGAIAIAQFAIESPNAPYVVVTSFVPLLSPFVMYTRITVGTVPAWQIALAIAINVAACVGFAWIGGRIYRVGLLLYGRFPTPRQLIAAFRNA